MPFDDLIALYSTADVALITPLRDGMNLVAKEYVSTRRNHDGVLILSEMAGAANELSQALVINPNNADDIAQALAQALEMPLEEQELRMKAMQRRVSRYTVDRWANDFMTALTSENGATENGTCRRIGKETEQSLVKGFENATNRLIILDYDGTLVGFKDNPADAVPDEELMEILQKLHARKDIEVAIISGRGKDFLEKWFGKMPLTLISDHGVWMRRNGKAWEQLEDPRADWKEQIYPIMENFSDRTPGTHIEEKQYSLAWHYRRAEDALALTRARELKILLSTMVPDLGLSVLDGNKVVEVKSQMVDKGRAVNRLTLDGQFDFVFAAGDDHTDEKMFAQLPEPAYTVKIGTAETLARHYVRDHKALRNLIGMFAAAD
jgi:trehalose 6-phosphate synthase/phosphatase